MTKRLVKLEGISVDVIGERLDHIIARLVKSKRICRKTVKLGWSRRPVHYWDGFEAALEAALRIVEQEKEDD